ncbi:MAG: LysR family transcriptional regulator [Acidobacteria bacterium]|nr:LysR family transcriptional regulator [Acidobacteriota bacterium]
MEIFCCVYEEKSFSKAAQRLYLTQPTISGHIKSLEEYFGTALFDRLGREIKPTRAGKLLYEHGRRIIEIKKIMVQGMSRFLNRLEGQLHLGASTIPGEYLLPSIIARFRGSHPTIQVSLMIRDTKAIIKDVEDGRVELGFVGARVPDRGLTFNEFATDRLILVVPMTPRWKKTNSISLNELKKEPLLIRESGSGTRLMFERKLNELGHNLEDFNIVAELGSTTAVKEAIKAKIGASILSHLAVQTELAAGLMKTIRIREIETLERDFFVVVNAKRARSPLCETFLEHMNLHL